MKKPALSSPEASTWHTEPGLEPLRHFSRAEIELRITGYLADQTKKLKRRAYPGKLNAAKKLNYGPIIIPAE